MGTINIKPPIHKQFAWQMDSDKHRRELRESAKPATEMRFDPNQQKLVNASLADRLFDKFRTLCGLQNWSEPSLVQNEAMLDLLQRKHWLSKDNPQDVESVRALVEKTGLKLGDGASEKAHPELARLAKGVLEELERKRIRDLARPNAQFYLMHRDKLKGLYNGNYLDDMADVVLHGDPVIPTENSTMPTPEPELVTPPSIEEVVLPETVVEPVEVAPVILEPTVETSTEPVAPVKTDTKKALTWKSIVILAAPFLLAGLYAKRDSIGDAMQSVQTSIVPTMRGWWDYTTTPIANFFTPTPFCNEKLPVINETSENLALYKEKVTIDSQICYEPRLKGQFPNTDTIRKPYSEGISINSQIQGFEIPEEVDAVTGGDAASQAFADEVSKYMRLLQQTKKEAEAIVQDELEPKQHDLDAHLQAARTAQRDVQVYAFPGSAEDKFEAGEKRLAEMHTSLDNMWSAHSDVKDARDRLSAKWKALNDGKLAFDKLVEDRKQTLKTNIDNTIATLTDQLGAVQSELTDADSSVERAKKAYEYAKTMKSSKVKGAKEEIYFIKKTYKNAQEHAKNVCARLETIQTTLKEAKEKQDKCNSQTSIQELEATSCTLTSVSTAALVNEATTAKVNALKEAEKAEEAKFRLERLYDKLLSNREEMLKVHPAGVVVHGYIEDFIHAIFVCNEANPNRFNAFDKLAEAQKVRHKMLDAEHAKLIKALNEYDRADSALKDRNNKLSDTAKAEQERVRSQNAQNAHTAYKAVMEAKTKLDNILMREAKTILSDISKNLEKAKTSDVTAQNHKKAADDIFKSAGDRFDRFVKSSENPIEGGPEAINELKYAYTEVLWHAWVASNIPTKLQEVYSEAGKVVDKLEKSNYEDATRLWVIDCTAAMLAIDVYRKERKAFEELEKLKEANDKFKALFDSSL